MKFLVRRRQVDQIRGVREDRLDDALLGEERAIVVGQLFAFPLIRILGEQRDCGYVQRCGALENGELPLMRALRLTTHERLIREMILQLKRGYLNVRYFRDKFATDIVERWADVWSDYEEDGLCAVDRDRERIELTREGLLKVDSLLPAFFEPQFQGVRYT